MNCLVQGKGHADGMDDTVAAGDINGEIGVGSEGFFSDDGVVDEVLTDGVSVFKGTAKGGKVSSDITRGNLSRDNLHLQNISGDFTTDGFVSGNSTVGEGEDGEGTGSGEFGGNAGGLKKGNKLV